MTYKWPRGSGSWEDPPPQVIYRSSTEGLGWGGTNRKGERIQRGEGPGTVAEPAVGVRIHRLSCVLRSNDGSGFKRDDLRRTEFICVGMKTCQNH